MGNQVVERNGGVIKATHLSINKGAAIVNLYERNEERRICLEEGKVGIRRGEKGSTEEN